jgi:uracil-DNA glycosylase
VVLPNLSRTIAFQNDIRACQICADLPLGPRPIFQFSGISKILIVGQAPGRITHDKGIPFDDPSGDRLRAWLGIDRDVFYDPYKLAIVPMGFCFPGTGKSGDLPPRPECAPAWRDRILETLSQVELTLILGRYAIDWHLPGYGKFTVTEAVKSWETHWPQALILPHPSPRNNRWLKQNPWFEREVVPALQARVSDLI